MICNMSRLGYHGTDRRIHQDQNFPTMERNTQNGISSSNGPSQGGNKSFRWVIKIGESRYGPYRFEELRAYVDAGRFAAHSVVTPEGVETWHLANDDDILKTLFESAAPAAEAAPAQADNKSPASGPTSGPASEDANFVIIFDVKSRPVGPLEEKLMALGAAVKLSTNVWLVNGAHTPTEVLNVLNSLIGSADSLFIVDATHNRTAWCNLGPEIDAKLADVWKR